jgi:dienelactone hydrolase
MQRILFVMLAAVCALAIPASAQQQAQRAPLDAFVGYDNFRSADISPNGRYVAAIRREAAGDIIFVYDLETRQTTTVTSARADHQMEIGSVEFKTDNRLVFVVLQKVHVVAGNNSMHRTEIIDDAFQWSARMYSANRDGSGLVSLYDPSEQQGFPRELSGGIVSMLPHDPDHVLIIIPNIGGAELRRSNVNTGEHSLVERGYNNTFNWIVDLNGTPVLRQDSIANGRGYAWLRRGPGQRGWTEIVRFRGAEGANSGPTFQGLGPALQPGQVFVLARRDGQDTSGLYVYDTATGQYVETLQTNAEFDVTSAVRDLRNNRVLAACWWAYRWTCEAKDASFGRHWNAVTTALGDQLNVELVSRGGEGGSRWIVRTTGPQDLGTYSLYDTNTRSLNVLFRARQVPEAQLPTSRVVHYTASDGRQLWGYLWIPPGVTNATNLPLIVVPHGGPEGRDTWGFDPFASTFASQGYAVFQPNFRGGGGFGRSFVEAGHRQWGQRMQDDVTDGTRHLIQQGIADGNRVCIMGWSYGGYVTFTASFQNTDLFKCAIAGAGVSDLAEMQRWVRAGSAREDVDDGGGQGSQSMSYRYWVQAIGDPDRDRDMLIQHSAARNAERVTIPLLIIHGEEDETVPIEQSQIMVRAMQRAGHQTRLIELTDMDHYYRPDNAAGWRLTFQESLAFFNQHIGPGVAPGSQ